jgi:hypothetical protein
MGNTQDERNPFVDWLYEKLADKKWKVSDLTRKIAEMEGFGAESEDFERRSRSIHGNVSNVVNRKRALGVDYARKIADALEVPQEDVMEMAGLLVRTEPSIAGKRPKPEKSPARQKIEALLDMLDRQEQEEAINILEAFAEGRKKAKRAAVERGLKRS